MNELPFSNCDQVEFIQLLNDSPIAVDFKDYLSTHNFRDILTKYTKDEQLSKLDCNYYTAEEFNTKFSKIQKNIEISILHLNIRSLNSKVREFCTLINILDIDFDVIVLSEIWAYNLEFYKNILKNYCLYFDLPNSSSIGGVGMFVKTSICPKLRNEFKLPTSSTVKCESLFVEITKNKNKTIVGGIYRHPNQNIDSFTNLLNVTLEKISKSRLPVFLCGDMNICLLKSENNTHTDNYLNNLLLHNCLPLILIPTRLSKRSSTLIDHIYYYEGSNNKKNLTIHSGNIFSDISDHLPNFVILSSRIDNSNIRNRPFIRLYTEKNKEIFRQKITNINWENNFYSNNNVNDCFNTFITVITNIINESFPLTRQSRRAFRDKKWMSRGLKISCIKKNNLYKKWRATNELNDEVEYKSYKKVYSKLIKKAETLHYSKLFDSKANSIKKLWANLNTICSGNKKSNKNASHIDKIIDNNGKEIILPAEISNFFNEYFCSVGSTLVQKLAPSSKNFTEYLNESLSNSIFIESVTVTELFNLLSVLKCNKSAGPDGISAKLLKENADLFCVPLCHLYNLSLNTGVVPDKFKIAKVIPIFKKDDICKVSNYRPISLLSIFNKLLEKIVYKRVYNFFEKNNILHKFQFGFRKNHSTSLALLDVIDSCYKNLDVNNIVVGIFCDLQKAFDTVNHSILLSKLYSYGIRGMMFNWLKDYLHNRKQFTVVNNVSSTIDYVTCGVPQGSVLGPLLFLVYMNDIHNAVPDNDLKLFADDTNLFLFGPDLKSIECQANISLQNLDMWFKANKLSLNVDKTFYTIFNKTIKYNNATLNLVINGQVINKVNSCKYLGVYLDSGFKWNEHVDYVYKKIIRFVGIFYKIKTLIPKDSLSKLYYAFVYPYISYGIEVYANACNEVLDKLIKANNKILRIILNKKYDTPSVELYKEFNVLSIPMLHEMKLLQLLYKFYHCKSMLPEVFQNYFMTNNVVHYHNTRSKFNLHISSVNSTFGQRSSTYRGSTSRGECNDLSAVFNLYIVLEATESTEVRNHGPLRAQLIFGTQ